MHESLDNSAKKAEKRFNYHFNEVVYCPISY
jgi:hypothetical protein